MQGSHNNHVSNRAKFDNGQLEKVKAKSMVLTRCNIEEAHVPASDDFLVFKVKKSFK